MTETGSPLYKLTLIVLSVYVLFALLIEAFWISDPEIKKILQYVDFFICLLFLIDFFICFFAAKSKIEYMKWGWIDLLASIPALDPLRWGRLSKVIRIIRYLRAIKSIRVLVGSLHANKFETLTLCVFLVVFFAFSLSAAFILEFERDYNSNISTAESALWWAFLNLMNAKSSISHAVSPEGVTMTIVLNKVGLLVFAYLNSMIVAWLVLQKKNSTKLSSDVCDDN
ncbi:ion transporter [bacterium SCSIO 12696]|nr:ion transporter [bacterium SCSIO 12696]